MLSVSAAVFTGMATRNYVDIRNLEEVPRIFHGIKDQGGIFLKASKALVAFCSVLGFQKEALLTPGAVQSTLPKDPWPLSSSIGGSQPA